MVDSYTAGFVGLLLAYMAYSVWARLDPRYPVAGGVGLLIVAGIADASGAYSAAGVLGIYAFFLFGAGVLLLTIDTARKPRRETLVVPAGGVEPATERGEAPDERHRATEEPLHGLEKETVPVVDRPGHDHDQEEEAPDPEHDQREKPQRRGGGKE